ncbi:putative methyltransferase-domain-containing protein [Chlamydoabsidia padenii]|nr:putative methyltransferase-domain-containing protein [Chlamydoabsidia padenii]
MAATTILQADEDRSDSSLILLGYDQDSQSDDSNVEAILERQRHVTKERLGDVEIDLWQDISGGCGGKTWEAAYVMIKYMLWKQALSPGFLAGKTILDLGSGTGLVGLAVAKGCQPSLAHMELTDQIPMMALLQDNIQLNQLDSKVGASILNWGEPSDHIVDIVFASDCVYLEVAFQPLVDTFITLTDNNKDIQIFITYRKRRKADKRFFLLLKKQFRIIDIVEDPERSVYSRQGLYLYRLERKLNNNGIKTPPHPLV